MIGRVLDRLTNSFTMLGGLALMLMMVQINLDVAGRYLLNHPLPGTIEIISNWYMVAVVFFPLATVEKHNAHISVEIISNYLSPRADRILIGCVSLLSAVYFAAFTWHTWGNAVEKYQVGEYIVGLIVVITWPTHFFVPLGCGMLTLLLVYKAVRLFSGDSSVMERPDQAILD